MSIGKVMDGYRGLHSMIAYSGRHHPANRPQGRWVSEGENLETAWYAGARMTVFKEDEGCYALLYLGMTDGMHFPTMEQAKEIAPDFARAVLLGMLADVAVGEAEPELTNCLRAFGFLENETN